MREVKCRIILPNGFQIHGRFQISNYSDLEKHVLKKYVPGYKRDKVDEIIFEDMVLNNVNSRKKLRNKN